jgi:two-component system sensor histidine kinase DesK
MVVPREIDYPFRSSADRRPRWWRFAISLLWMAFPLGALFADDPSPAHLGLVLAGFAAFVVCYGNALIGPWDRITWRQRVPWLVAGAIIATALVIGDRPDWGILFIFLAVVSAARLPEPQSVLAVGLASVLATGTMLIAGSEGWTALSVGLTAGGIGFLFLLISRLARAYDELRAAQDELAQAAVNEERLRFARDLHDLLGHSLSVISLKAQLAGRLLPDHPAEAATHVSDLEHVSREALQEVRAAVAGYARPTLAGELAGARTALEAAGIEPQLDATVDLPEDVEELLAWTVREGTTNVLRHSDASMARIVVAGGGPSAAVEIVDNGSGDGADDGGRGLAGLRERASRLGGSVEAGPLPDGGFRLRVEVPLA